MLNCNKREALRFLGYISSILVFSLCLSFISFAFLPNFLSEEQSVYALAEAEYLPVVVIDAGHGGEDCGAIGANGVYEKDLNLQIANTLKEYLDKSGFITVMTRTTDRLMYNEDQNIKGMKKIYDLRNRTEIANSYENAILVSIHMNSFSDSRYSGLQVYYGKAEGGSALANNIQTEVKRLLQPTNNRKIKSGASLYLMDNSINPSVLIECGFISNEAECEKLSEKEYQKELCFSILCGIIKYKENQNQAK